MLKLLLLLLFSTALFSVEFIGSTGSYYAKSAGVTLYKKELFKDSTSSINNQVQYHFYMWMQMDIQKEYFPKVRFDYTRIRSTGTSIIQLGTKNKLLLGLADAARLQNRELNSLLVYNIFDLFMYYSFFDEKKYAEVSIGAGVKSLNYDYDIELFQGVQFNDKGATSIPMIYFDARKLFFKVIALDLETKYYPLGESEAYDLRIKTDVYFKVNKKINAGFEFGYRDSYINVKGKDVLDVGGDMHYQGVFLGVIAKFK